MSSNWPFNIDDLNRQYGKDFGNKFQYKPICPECHGTRYIESTDGRTRTTHPCPECHNTFKGKV